MPDPITPGASAPVRPHAHKGHLVAGRYELVRLIASGGMAEVWEAHDQVLGRQVALKLLHRHLADNQTFTQRFRAEAIAAARLHHTSIVSIYDTCTDNGYEAIVMELVRGRTLRHYLDERHQLPPDEVVQIGADVADALAAAHRARIVHRDIKPANILLCDDARVMVTDFGIAKVRDDTDLTSTGTMLGTVKYLAPEQVESAPVDARTDVYALGVVLYESLVGRPPFVGDTAAATALARLHQTPRAPREYRPQLPAGLDAAVMRCLARDPDERFASASELRAALLAPVDLRPAFREEERAHDKTVVTPLVVPADPTTWAPPPPRPAPVPVTAAPAIAPRATTTDPAPARRLEWLLPAVLVLLIGGSIGLAVALVARTQAGDPGVGEAAAGAAPVAIAEALAFDPLGDGGEHDNEARLVVDGNPDTAWRSEEYATPAFGGIKPGVGVMLSLEQAARLRDLRVESPTTGWAAQIYVADEPRETLEDWGEPVTSASDLDGSTTFDLGATEGRAVLVWITQLGSSPNRMQLDELVVRS